MADITICTTENCPLAGECYRKLAPKGNIYKAFNPRTTANGQTHCPGFIPAKNEQEIKKMSAYAKDVAEHEFMERMIPTIIAQLKQQQWQEPYAHPDYINHCAKMRKIRVRIVEEETREIVELSPQVSEPYDCAKGESSGKVFY